MFPIAKPSTESMAKTHRNNNAFHWTAAAVASAVESSQHPEVGGSWTITPLKRTGRNNSSTYPSQELRNEGHDATTSYSDTCMTPLPRLHPLQQDVDSVATTYEDDARKRHVEEMASSTATVKNDQLDSFVMDCKITAVQHDSEVLDEWFRSEVIPASTHTTPSGATKITSGRTVVKSPKKRLVLHATKAGVAKSRTKTTVVVPNELDILRGEYRMKCLTDNVTHFYSLSSVDVHPSLLATIGRGGHTNRHEGNKRFRDEARKLRASYRDENTNRDKKFLLSQELVRRVSEYGGRFLEQSYDKLWHIMDDHGARKKASQGML